MTKTFSKDELVGMSIPARVKEELISGIYFLIHKGEIVYVGSSENILVRLGQHKRNQRLPFDSYSYIEYDDIELMRLHEINYIIEFAPKNNSDFNPNYDYELNLILKHHHENEIPLPSYWKSESHRKEILNKIGYKSKVRSIYPPSEQTDIKRTLKDVLKIFSMQKKRSEMELYQGLINKFYNDFMTFHEEMVEKKFVERQRR